MGEPTEENRDDWRDDHVITLEELKWILDHELHGFFREGNIRRIMREARLKSFECQKKVERTVTIASVTVS